MTNNRSMIVKKISESSMVSEAISTLLSSDDKTEFINSKFWKQRIVNTVLDSLIYEIRRCIEKNETVTIQKFMTIETCEHSERRGRDPVTGKVITYPPSKKARCRLMPFMLDAVNKQESGRIKDITGQRFGNLVVRQYSKSNSNGDAYWLCDCDCGQTCIVRGTYLRNGKKTSCGCQRKKETEKNNQILNKSFDKDVEIGFVDFFSMLTGEKI